MTSSIVDIFLILVTFKFVASFVGEHYFLFLLT